MTQRHYIGIDEAGRGPLAGPVAVGVCTASVRRPHILKGIRDSKKLSQTQRDAWYHTITTAQNMRCVVAFTHASVIDKKGIVAAVNSALVRALRKLKIQPCHCTVLLDGGLRAPAEYKQQKTIIRGDSSEPLISAGAIVAKVTRDRYMERSAKKYPEYQFAQHKGYGTALHRRTLQKHGACPLHRLTFCHLEPVHK